MHICSWNYTNYALNTKPGFIAPRSTKSSWKNAMVIILNCVHSFLRWGVSQLHKSIHQWLLLQEAAWDIHRCCFCFQEMSCIWASPQKHVHGQCIRSVHWRPAQNVDECLQCAPENCIEDESELADPAFRISWSLVASCSMLSMLLFWNGIAKTWNRKSGVALSSAIGKELVNQSVASMTILVVWWSLALCAV